MAGKCEYCDKAMPQWCGDCGGFIGWHCYVCGESRVEARRTQGHCRCAKRSTAWVDGPPPTIGLLVDAAMRMDGLDPADSEARDAYMARIVVAAVYGKGGRA